MVFENIKMALSKIDIANGVSTMGVLLSVLDIKGILTVLALATGVVMNLVNVYYKIKNKK